MAKTIRKQLKDKVVVRFQAIKITGGYNTNLGLHIFWRKTSPFQDGDMPGVDLITVSRDVTRENVAIGFQDNFLNIEAYIVAAAGSVTEDEIEKMIADIEKAIKVDPKWDGLATDTELTGDDIDLDQAEDIVGVAKVMFTITYRTIKYDAYTQ